ncbi:MAG TPA: carboxypeptidase-like regulatory domain-containing protein [Bryobacteraceae bacterium]|nr:carboxypeptidase-like regulatory domain-containing protein [Bryobacteraceae bacterium]
MSTDDGTSRLILIALMLAASDLAAQTVEGHVVNAVTGADIGGATVNLIQSAKVAYSATTDPRGHFQITAVKPGAYTASYMTRGFWPIPNLSLDEDFERECGQCFFTERGGHPFEVIGGPDPLRLEARMQPIGKISGRVLDDAGEPVPNAAIFLHWGENWLCRTPSCLGILRQTRSDRNGAFSITDLDVPGAWLLSAIAPSSLTPPERRDDRRVEWAQSFYPGVASAQLAVRVIVGTGGDVSNLDIRLVAVPVHRIRGVVLDINGDPAPKAVVTLSNTIRSPALVRRTGDDGAFEFEAAAEGPWRISAKLEHGSTQLWTARWVQVETHDSEDVELRPAAPFAIRGRVVMEAPEGAPTQKRPGITLAYNDGVAALATNPPDPFPTASPNANGEFEIRNVYSGAYQILPGPPPSQYYLDSIQIGGRDALGAAVDLMPGAQPLIVTYKFGGGTVRGAVENCSTGTVRLLPRDRARRRPGFVLFTPCDSNDRYEISAVRPGDYYALANAGNSPTAWYATTWDDEGLLNTATTVSVRAGENTSADLRAISH